MAHVAYDQYKIVTVGLSILPSKCGEWNESFAWICKLQKRNYKNTKQILTSFL
jgi:hypothetical protein